MGQARDEAGNIWETDAAGNPVRLIQPAQQARGAVIQDPYRAAEEQRRNEDQALDRARLGISQQTANATAQNAGVSAQNAQIAAAKAERDRLEWEATHFADGTPRPKASASAQANPDRVPQIETVLENIRRIREMADDRLAVGSYSGWVGDVPLIGPALGQNRKNIEGALQMVQGDLIQQQIALLSQMNGDKGVASIANSETEAARMAASIANLSPDQDLEEFTRGVDRAEQYYLRQLARLEGADTNDPEVRKFYDIREPGSPPAPPNAFTRVRMGNPQGPQAAGVGAEAGQKITVPPEMNAEHDALVARLLQEGGGRIDPDAYAQGMAAISARYPDFGTAPGSSEQWARDMNAYLESGGKTIPSGVSLEDRDLSALEQFRNDVVSHPVGSFFASAGNAGGLGLPSLLASDQTAAMRELNPGSSLAGEVVGGVTGTMAAGGALGAAASKVANPTVARLLANPMTADVAYGSAYGATQADDPLYGAVTGATGAFLGNKLGSAAGRTLPAITGVRRADDVLAAGERRVFDAASKTGFDPVVAALQQADELGVPASLADVSPEVNSLTGAALRRSPTAAGDARVALGDRSRGQYDRFLGAVERDLGPIENIPQRSEDLITQARTQAGPLYDTAYAAPGAENIDLSDLADRPTFTAALREAYGEVLDEGLDPSAMGLQQAGDDILVASPSWQSLDYVKRGLDNIIERNTSKIDGVTPEGRRAIAMKNLLLSRMDELNPDYAAARAAYAGPAQERAAMQSGAQALTMSPNQLGVNVGKASPSQVGQMQLGFQSALGEQAGRYRQSTNPFEATLGTPGMEQRLATLYPEGGDNIARLLAQRDLEREVAGSANRLVGNSMTAERGVADQAFGQSSLAGDIATGSVETLLTGAPVVTAARSGLGRGLGNAVRDWRTLGIGAKATALADEIAPLALNMDPEDAAAQLLEMATKDASYQQIVDELLQRAATRGGHAGASAGTAAATIPMR